MCLCLRLHQLALDPASDMADFKTASLQKYAAQPLLAFVSSSGADWPKRVLPFVQASSAPQKNRTSVTKSLAHYV